MRTYVYIDGFNLYYRMLKARPALKWLNPLALAKAVLKPEHVVERVNYYSARISARAHDPDAPARQAIYRKALASMPEIVIHDGNFMMSEPWMPLTEPAQAKPGAWLARPCQSAGLAAHNGSPGRQTSSPTGRSCSWPRTWRVRRVSASAAALPEP